MYSLYTAQYEEWKEGEGKKVQQYCNVGLVFVRFGLYIYVYARKYFLGGLYIHKFTACSFFNAGWSYSYCFFLLSQGMLKRAEEEKKVTRGRKKKRKRQIEIQSDRLER